jgi:hypothetical protein
MSRLTMMTSTNDSVLIKQRLYYQLYSSVRLHKDSANVQRMMTYLEIKKKEIFY